MSQTNKPGESDTEDFLDFSLAGRDEIEQGHEEEDVGKQNAEETQKSPIGPYSLSGGDNGTYVLHLGERNWVIGLDWVTYHERKPKSEVIREAKEQNAQFVFRRDADESVQDGFSHYMKGIKKPSQLRSLAASLAEGTAQPWRGIYQISDNLWWYIAVRDGFAILPDSDVVGTSEEINIAMRAHQGMGGWRTWTGNLADLEDLVINKTTRSSKPIVVDQTKTKIYLLSGCALIGLGIGGVYLHHKHELQLQQDLKAMEQHRLIQQRIEEEKALENMPSPATHMPMPNEMLEACWDKANALPVFNEGWELAKFSCDQENLNVLWQRGPGATLYAAPAGGIMKQGEEIESQIKLNINNKTPDNTGEIETAAREMQSLLQLAGVDDATISIDIPRPKPIKQSDMSLKSAPPPPPPPPTARVEFTWPTFPIGTNWDAVPGLRIKSVEKDAKGWDVTAIIYGKRENIYQK